jgi:hypothetical protein
MGRVLFVDAAQGLEPLSGQPLRRLGDILRAPTPRRQSLIAVVEEHAGEIGH